MSAPATHIVIPDTQVRPGVPTDHLKWIGRYIWDQFHDRSNVRVIHLGDHWDMPSLSSWDKPGSKSVEGRRYMDDVRAGNEALSLLTETIETRNANRRQNKKPQWRPDLHLLRGNHEDRITRAVDEGPKWEGLVGMHHLESPGWIVHDFLKPVCLDGVWYAHYWSNPMNGRPMGGNAANRLNKLGRTCVMGHQQTLDYAIRFVGSQSQHFLVAGACYLHDEEYRSYQGNEAHWRGIVVLFQVEDGSFDPMFVSLDFLCRKYEGKRLREFLDARGE